MAGLMEPSARENESLASMAESNLENEPLMPTYVAIQSASATESRDYLDQEPRTKLYLFLLTLSMGGLEIVWSAQHSNGSPFLASLGMSKSLLAFVWVAGPLTGIIAQPYIGIRSDNCRSSWGKRKPFMVIGGAATVIFLLALAWVREIASVITGVFNIDIQSDGAKVTTIVIATVLVYCLDFSINSVQAAIRAFIVDNAPAHQQDLANAWGSRLASAGNIFGYILGYMNLPKAFPIFGNTQFKVLGVIASFSLAITIGISCSYIKEKDPRKERPALQNLSIISCCTLTLRYIPRLSLRIRKVCGIQFAAWCGWLPFLFYSTMFIGQIYANPIFEKDRDLSDGEITKIWEDATRVGTFALLINAVISLVASVVLPLLVTPSDKEIKKPVDASINSEPQRPVSTPDISGWATVNEHNTETHNNRRDLSKFGIPGLTLKRAWLLSHVLFAGCMFSTALISSVQAASAIIGIVGVSWAVTLWAPFAFISAEVAQYNQAEIQSQDVQVRSYDERRMPWATDDYEGPLVDDEDRAANQSGVVLGIHNICVSFPQIISTLISSGIFHALQKPRGEPWDDSVGWVLRFAGCAALLAAFLTNSM